MRIVATGLLLLGLLALSACATNTADQALLLIFQEQEQGLQPYRVRMLITHRYMRIDDGEGSKDYVLFDRRHKNIFSTNSEDKRTLLISEQDIVIKAPTTMRHEHKSEQGGYPRIDGKAVMRHQYFTNRQLCMDIFAAKDLLPDANQALREYYTVLASEHAAGLDSRAMAMQNACDLANNIFMPIRHLQAGLPIRQQDMHGRVRELIDFKRSVAVKPALFVLPEDHRVFNTESLRTR